MSPRQELYLANFYLYYDEQQSGRLSTANMNGVRRLLGAAASPSPPTRPDPLPNIPAIPPQTPQSTIPLAFTPKSGPTWPPSTSPTSVYSPNSEPSPRPPMTASLFLKKDRSRPPAADEDPSTSSVPYGSPGRQTANLSLSQGSYSNRSPTRSQTVPSSPASSSSPRSTTNRYSARKSVNTDPGWKRMSGNLNTRDELLMSLMASEAVIDSREYEILNGEDVDELKKEYQVLTSRLGALTKKLALETKIRDAALSLSKVNASHKKVSKQTSEQLDAANRRVDSAQTELWKVSDRVNEVNRRLMEHRAGVLGFQVRNMEKKMSSSTEDSSESNRSTLMSPALSSMTSVSSSSKGRFDGAHLFAGHADAIVPKAKLSAEAAAAEITALEEKLKAAKDQLTESGKKQAEMTRELSLMRLEKQEVETVMGMDLQAAEETIAALEKEIPRLEELNEEVQTLRKEKSAWEEEREELEERGRQVEILQARLMDSEARTGEAAGGAERMLSELREKTAKQLSEKDAELARLKAERDAERAEWEQERQQIEDERMEDLARLQEEMERTREEDETAVAEANQELSTGLATLQSMVKTHGIVLFSRDSSLKGLLDAIGTHIETVHGKLDGHARAEAEWEMARRKLEDDVRAGLDKRESLTRELEEARRERDAAKRETLSIETRAARAIPSHMRNGSMASTPISPSLSTPLPLDDYAGDMDVGRIVAVLQPLWQILPSPEARAAKFGSASSRNFRTGSPTPSTPGGANPNGVASSLSDLDVRSLKSLYDTRQNGQTTPSSPRPGNGPFSIEAFAQRVQALINDDKALIERLIRFAQAHDLLKKNAERAQKLAQEGNTAMETYQKQVRMLEERNMSMGAKQAAIQDELLLLHETIERMSAEKRELEMRAAEQGETLEQLTEANNTLSARTLTLAEEAAMAPEMVRKQLEAQLQETRKKLELAQEEIDGMRMSEQSQRIALLDELNSMQTENGNLRAQLRAVKK